MRFSARICDAMRGHWAQIVTEYTDDLSPVNGTHALCTTYTGICPVCKRPGFTLFPSGYSYCSDCQHECNGIALMQQILKVGRTKAILFLANWLEISGTEHAADRRLTL